MTASWHFYDSFQKKIGQAPVDLASDTIKVMICSSSYTPNVTTHVFRSDLTNEVSGSGYTAGGATLASKTLTLASHITTFDAADVTWNTVAFTNGRYAVLYKSRGGASSADELIGYVDFGVDQSPAGVDFTITWNASGIFTISYI